MHIFLSFSLPFLLSYSGVFLPNPTRCAWLPLHMTILHDTHTHTHTHTHSVGVLCMRDRTVTETST